MVKYSLKYNQKYNFPTIQTMNTIRRIRSVKSMKLSKRCVGCYRPTGFKPNIFIVFRTGNIVSYTNYVFNKHNKFQEEGIFELSELFGINCSPPLIMCSPKNFNSRTELILGYHDLLNKIESDNNIVHVAKPTPKNVPFTVVELVNENSNYEYLKNVLNDL